MFSARCGEDSHKKVPKLVRAGLLTNSYWQQCHYCNATNVYSAIFHLFATKEDLLSSLEGIQNLIIVNQSSFAAIFQNRNLQ